MDGYVIPAAFVLDLILGDPRGCPHPIRWMGRAIEILEPVFRRFFVHPGVAGGFFAAFLIFSCWISSWAAMGVAHAFHPALGIGAEIVLVYFSISARDLEKSAMAVGRALKEKGMGPAKKELSMIVGRDVNGLDEAGVIRAGVETVAENLVDGVISPLFFAAIGGAPLAMAYKMVNTLDSMVGYKNERYLEFGRWAARTDDAANFIPARLSVPVIALAVRLLGGNWRRSLATGLSEGRRHASPNAGFPEAAFAGALGVRLGGPNVYHGQRVEKPYIGSAFGAVDAEDIRRACRLMVVSALLWMAMAGAASAML